MRYGPFSENGLILYLGAALCIVIVVHLGAKAWEIVRSLAPYIGLGV